MFFPLTVNVSKVQQDDFHPKQIATIQSQMGSSGTKSPQVAVIPPLVDLTKVSGEGNSQDSDDKSNGKKNSFLYCTMQVLFSACAYTCTCTCTVHVIIHHVHVCACVMPFMSPTPGTQCTPDSSPNDKQSQPVIRRFWTTSWKPLNVV